MRRATAALAAATLAVGPVVLVLGLLSTSASATSPTLAPSMSILPGTVVGKIIETTLFLDNTGPDPATGVQVQLVATDGTVSFAGADNDATCSGVGSSLTCLPYDGTIGTGNGRHWQHEVDPRAVAVGSDGRIVVTVSVTWTDALGAHSASSSTVVAFPTATPTPTPTPTATPTRTATTTPPKPSSSAPTPTRSTSSTQPATPVAGSGISPTTNATVATPSAASATSSTQVTGSASSTPSAADGTPVPVSGSATKPVTITDAVAPILGSCAIMALVFGAVGLRRRVSRKS